MDKTKKDLQYHPPACAALELELRADRDVLDFQSELDHVVIYARAEAGKADELAEKEWVYGNRVPERHLSHSQKRAL